jgi:hypothetical protein
MRVISWCLLSVGCFTLPLWFSTCLGNKECAWRCFFVATITDPDRTNYEKSSSRWCWLVFLRGSGPYAQTKADEQAVRKLPQTALTTGIDMMLTS